MASPGLALPRPPEWRGEWPPKIEEGERTLRGRRWSIAVPAAYSLACALVADARGDPRNLVRGRLLLWSIAMSQCETALRGGWATRAADALRELASGAAPLARMRWEGVRLVVVDRVQVEIGEWRCEGTWRGVRRALAARGLDAPRECPVRDPVVVLIASGGIVVRNAADDSAFR